MKRIQISEVRSLSLQGEAAVQEDFVSFSVDKGVFVVADGFGGRGVGDKVSRIVCEQIRYFLEKEAGDLEATMPFVLRKYYTLAGNVLFNAILHGNRNAQSFNRGKNIHERGGASTLAAFINGSVLALAQVGACSAWLYRNLQWSRLCTPRTYQQMVDPATSESLLYWQAPLSAVGMTDDLEPEIFEYRMLSGDVLLLQSPGVLSAHRKHLVHSETGLLDLKSVEELAGFAQNASLLAIRF